MVIRCQLPDHDVMVNINAALFEWVIENLCKNAVDAMDGGPGTISIAVMETGQKVAIRMCSVQDLLPRSVVGGSAFRSPSE